MFIAIKLVAAVTDSAFIVLVSTIVNIDQIVVTSVTVILGVDKFISETCAINNLICNIYATTVISTWKQSFGAEKTTILFNNETIKKVQEPELVVIKY